ncbi:putative 2OG-Fe(II) oxygenase [Leptolyngbya sp. 7M]|uniref:putative 2OG-Fe(II) oxygenase n=1 Tax=Leptolyngbya sp. 7M TaxID=2812896 RepID=UPI001B8B098F|nr:putative 2OG-Fe(II) oxygenase [Leptolyngbya sp. 7M]QYO64767.1 2OG-Fe(II) oxygenase family protein [Leptolyngbya sp. 7M]
MRLEKAGYHIAHVHPDGWISSAFYFVVPDCDPGAADGGLLALGGAPEELGLDIKPRRIVRPTPGWLCLFPSMVWHETTPVQVDAERLTTAFDVVPVV